MPKHYEQVAFGCWISNMNDFIFQAMISQSIRDSTLVGGGELSKALTWKEGGLGNHLLPHTSMLAPFPTRHIEPSSTTNFPNKRITPTPWSIMKRACCIIFSSKNTITKELITIKNRPPLLCEKTNIKHISILKAQGTIWIWIDLLQSFIFHSLFYHLAQSQRNFFKFMHGPFNYNLWCKAGPFFLQPLLKDSRTENSSWNLGYEEI